MDDLTTNLAKRGGMASRAPMIGLTVLLVLGATSCISTEKHERLLREAVQAEQERAALKLKEVQAQADARFKAITEARERDKAQADAEIAKVRIEATQERIGIAAGNYAAGSQGLPFPEYRPLIAPSLLSQSVFWLCLLITLGALGAAGVWLIRDPVAWTQWAKSLIVPVSIYAFMRFMPGVTNKIFSTGLAHTGLTECALVIAGFVYALVFDRYLRERRRLLLDLLGISITTLLMMAAAEFFVFNREALMASTLGLRLAACAPIGGAVFALGKAVRKSTGRRTIGVQRDAQAGRGPGETGEFHSVVADS